MQAKDNTHKIILELCEAFQNNYAYNSKYPEVTVEMDPDSSEIWVHDADKDIAAESKILFDRVCNGLEYEDLELTYDYEFVAYGEGVDGKVVHFSNINLE